MNSIFNIFFEVGSEKENPFRNIAEAAESQQGILHDIAEIEEMNFRGNNVLNDTITCVKKGEN